MERSSDSDSSPKLHPSACFQSHKVARSLIESEDSLLPSPTKAKPSKIDSDRTMYESISFSEHTGRPEIEKNSDSDSSSIILSRDFKTLSLASKKSSILFPSQSSKMSLLSTNGVNIQNSQTSPVLNSQFSTEITLDQVDQMMEGIIPNESTDSNFRFDLPSQFMFKESPNFENYGEKFKVSNFSDISVLSSSALEKTSVAEEIPDKFSVLRSYEDAVSRRHSSNFTSQNTTYPASRSTLDENFSSSPYSLEIATNENIENEFADGEVSDSSFLIKEPSITRKKSKGFFSSNSDSLPTRRYCFSLPIDRKSSGLKKQVRKRQVNVVADTDNTSDEDVFRDSSFKSLPTRLEKKSTSFSARQVRRKYFQNKENQIEEKKSQRNFEKVARESQKSPLSAAIKSRQFPNHEKKKSSISSLKSSQFAVINDDEFESDELNAALNDSLSQFNKWKKNKDVPESDVESTTSQCFDEDIAQLLTEYAALNAEQQPSSLSSNLSNTESTTFMPTLSVKSNSPHSNPKHRAPSRKPVTSSGSNYKDIMWNSYPDSLETALTTSEEKLDEVRNNLREKAVNSNSQKLFSSQNSKSSRENERDSFGLLDWD